MHSRVRTMVETDQSAERLGITDVEADDGRAVSRLLVAPDMANGHGVAHGGFVFALADYAFACAANTVLADIATVEASISYLSPAHVGDALVAEAATTYFDERRVVVDVTVSAGDVTVALFRGSGRRMSKSRRA
ncbi:MAG: PaaI family thioesterase [Gulosibacter sp.]|uniref:PaaI family thioesterase n=1 Tax=Gulosibacter sp. TaxID=2817531 RepID=UPI003F92BF17